MSEGGMSNEMARPHREGVRITRRRAALAAGVMAIAGALGINHVNNQPQPAHGNERDPNPVTQNLDTAFQLEMRKKLNSELALGENEEKIGDVRVISYSDDEPFINLRNGIAPSDAAITEVLGPLREVDVVGKLKPGTILRNVIEVPGSISTSKDGHRWAFVLGKDIELVYDEKGERTIELDPERAYNLSERYITPLEEPTE